MLAPALLYRHKAAATGVRTIVLTIVPGRTIGVKVVAKADGQEEIRVVIFDTSLVAPGLGHADLGFEAKSLIPAARCDRLIQIDDGNVSADLKMIIQRP